MMNRLIQVSRSLPRRQNLSTLPILTKYQANDELPHGWTVVKATSVPELNLENAVHLKHKFCNAQWLHMENPTDSTNAFSIHLKTVPQDSTGIAHILEHCTLCGSHRYPVRDPFMKMLNRSLASMNAMTGPDYTFYPFSTPNKKDFYNLMQVYLDSVFNPLLREMDFRQEGWRLDMDQDTQKLAIKGVVFNEMKGAFADAQQVLGQQLLNNLLPSNTYGHCSGGLPECIPQLTWQDLRNFHSVHYSPNNARFYSYGNIPLEEHLEAVNEYLPPRQSEILQQNVATVPNEVRWSEPRKKHIYCPEDPSGASTTLAVSYLTCDIEDSYETFVLRVLSELLTEGPSAPLYQSLIESGLASAFSPVTGYDAYTKDTGFTIAVQGIELAKAADIEQTIYQTLAQAAQDGFDKDRIQAILNRTELSLKKQVDDFGWKMIMSLTSGWNHVSDPLLLLQINPILDRFKADLENGDQFLRSKIRQYFLENNHRLTLTMSPKGDFLTQQQKVLDDLEENLVEQLDAVGRQKAIEQGQLLEKMQSAKDEEETIACLPTLRLSDIAHTLPEHSGLESITLRGHGANGQRSVQPTNEVAYLKCRLNVESRLSESERELLPLFSSMLTSMGAGDKNYRQMDIKMELHTGGMGASLHCSEDPTNASHLIQNGLLISSHCLERNTPEMMSLWNDIFHGFLQPHSGQAETSSEGLKTRLSQLICMSAVESKNGLAYGGHHYAMAHAAAKLKHLPALLKRENQSGLTMIRLLNSIANDPSKMDLVYQHLSEMSKKILDCSNIESFSICTTPAKADAFTEEMENFINRLPKRSFDTLDVNSELKIDQVESNSLIVAPFPIYFCSAALPGAPSYTHPDAAPLRVLSRLLSAKFLHVEIREKGGAYGGGCSANPTAGVITFYSYRDPNCERTFDTFHSCNDWVQKGQESFSERDVEEAKLSVFKAVDKPPLPSARGQRLFLSGISNEQFAEHRRQLRQVTSADVQRVSDKYLAQSRAKACMTSLGPQTEINSYDFKLEELLVQ